jgi:predicted nicotinamide N-methyase
VRVYPQGVTRYLTSIISSDLRWIEDEEAQEEIWSQASLRLSERSGRSGMPSMSRTFRIPSQLAEVGDPIELVIHEPALTADNLGLKTWASSYLLSKRLCTLDLAIPTNHDRSKPQILELGSGTGLVGLAAACVFRTNALLTDLPSIIPNLTHNVQQNRDMIEQNHGVVQSGILDWAEPALCQLYSNDIGAAEESLNCKFPIILAADSLYSPELPRMLAATIKVWLSDESTARVVVEFPFREGYLSELDEFRARMEDIGLRILQEGEDFGRDDWGSGGESVEDHDALVKCWWAVWGWQIRKPESATPP